MPRLLASLLLLQDVSAVTKLLVDPTARNGSGALVCLTAKVANTVVADYVRWVRAGPPNACLWSYKGTTHVLKSREACRETCGRERCRQHREDEPDPLLACPYGRGGALRKCSKRHLAQLYDVSTWLVPVRDPYTKLLSAFQKHNRTCHLDDACFQREFVNGYSTNKRDGPALVRYLAAVVAESQENHHVWLQTEQCLAPPMVKLAKKHAARRVAVPIEDGLDALGRALGEPPERWPSAIMSGAYSRDTACYALEQRHLPIVGRVSRLLAGEYAALREQFGIDYSASEGALAAAAVSKHVALCTFYGIFARNDTREPWKALLNHSSHASNARSRGEFCCDGVT